MLINDVAPIGRARGGRLRIAVHDFGGYAFPVELSRRLASEGHVVRHFVCADVFSGKADLRRLEDDSERLSFEKISAATKQVRKYDPVRRLRWEWDYGRRLAHRVGAFRPDVVLSANTPLIAQRRLFAHLADDVARVVWLQDLVSIAIERHVAVRSRTLSAAVAPLLRGLELALARNSDHIVTIAPQFTDFLTAGGVERSKITEIRNWAPVRDLPVGERMNSWRRAQGFGDDFLVVYSGTLGLKHDPLILVEAAKRLPTGSRVVVLAEGPGVERLRLLAGDIPNLELLPLVGYEELPAVLAAADVLVALLESDASAFSVPSKVLTYLCAGRAIVASVSEENLAAIILAKESGGGVVVSPGDPGALAIAVEAVRADPHYAAALGRAGRAYAEREFDADHIAELFQVVLSRALTMRASSSGRPHAPVRESELVESTR